jgi:hypothetical protein
MQGDENNNKRNIPSRVEISDVPPFTDNKTHSKAEDVSIFAGTTKLSKEELHHSFKKEI